MFMNVELRSRTGKLVASVRVPNFATPIEVILWGNRIFRWTGDDYREAFSYAVPVEPIRD